MSNWKRIPYTIWQRLSTWPTSWGPLAGTYKPSWLDNSYEMCCNEVPRPKLQWCPTCQRVRAVWPKVQDLRFVFWQCPSGHLRRLDDLDGDQEAPRPNARDYIREEDPFGRARYRVQPVQDYAGRWLDEDGDILPPRPPDREAWQRFIAGLNREVQQEPNYRYVWWDANQGAYANANVQVDQG